VELKDSTRGKIKWVPAEVYDVDWDGMYKERTYCVRLVNSRRKEKFVPTEELRFSKDCEMEKRLREDEFDLLREDMKQFNLKLTRQERDRRGGRGSSQDAARSYWHRRARSADGHATRTDRDNHRSMSLPAENRYPDFMPRFVADFVNALDTRGYQGRMRKDIDNKKTSDDDDRKNVEFRSENRNRRRNDLNEDPRGRRNACYDDRAEANPRAEANRGGEDTEFKRSSVERKPQSDYIYVQDRHKTYRVDTRDGIQVDLNWYVNRR